MKTIYGLDRRNQSEYYRIFVFWLIASLIFTPVFSLKEVNLQAADQTSCANHIKVAEESYYAGDFERATEFVNLCLREPGVSDDYQIKAYTILTRIALAEDAQPKARTYIEIILKIDPEYAPTIEQETPKYVNLVAEIRASLSEDATDNDGFNKWILVGAGGVATTAIILLVAAKGGEKDNGTEILPEPPAFP
jgi:hypothetical protein